MPFYIKERSNPQLGTYFVPMGKMLVKDARKYESKMLYGTNTMHRFDSQDEYESRLSQLEQDGETVQR